MRKYQRIITRKAVLIVSPGKGNNFLPGAKKDPINVKEFLKSESGGAWYDEEIVILNDPSYFEVQQTVDGAIADYVFVYYSGHGYTDAEKNRMLCLRDYNISDTTLLNASPRQLVVIDACRNFAGEGLGEIIFPEPEFYYFEGSPARDIFTTYIENSPVGKLIVHGTRSGHYSYDSPTGGMFTSALLSVSARINAPVTYLPATIKSVLSHVPSVLEEKGNSQRPSIAYQLGNMTVPFAIGVPRGVYRRQVRKIPQRTVQAVQSTGNGWGGLAATVLIVCAIAAVAK
jgi:hypothetical protein